MSALRTWTVYVVRLRPEVATRSKFQRKNRGYRPGAPCFYVGATSETAAIRYAKHRRADPKRTLVTDFGAGLVPGYGTTGIRSEAEARRVEANTANRLQDAGFGVYSCCRGVGAGRRGDT